MADDEVLSTAEEFGRRPDPSYVEELIRGKIVPDERWWESSAVSSRNLRHVRQPCLRKDANSRRVRAGLFQRLERGLPEGRLCGE